MLNTVLYFVMSVGICVVGAFLVIGGNAFLNTHEIFGAILLILGVICLFGGGLLLLTMPSWIANSNQLCCPECNANIANNQYGFCPWCGIELKG